MELKIKPIGGIVPDQPQKGDAGYDLRTPSDFVLFGGESGFVIKLGIVVEIPEGYIGFITDRSSVAIKKVFVSGGIIDSGYRGEIAVIMNNNNTKPIRFSKGNKIAQMIIVPVATPPVVVVSNVSKTMRGAKGFGSTGVS